MSSRGTSSERETRIRRGMRRGKCEEWEWGISEETFGNSWMEQRRQKVCLRMLLKCTPEVTVCNFWRFSTVL